MCMVEYPDMWKYKRNRALTEGGMGGQSTITCFNGDQVRIGRLDRHRIMGPLHLLQTHKAAELKPIKLKRKMVQACKSGRSTAFSLESGHDGHQAVIWCTDNNSNFLLAFAGVLRKVSNHPGDCKYVLVPEREVSKEEFERLRLKA